MPIDVDAMLLPDLGRLSLGSTHRCVPCGVGPPGPGGGPDPNQECPICKEELGTDGNGNPYHEGAVEPWIDVCGNRHYYHKWCVKRWLEKDPKQSCPLCRRLAPPSPSRRPSTRRRP